MDINTVLEGLTPSSNLDCICIYKITWESQINPIIAVANRKIGFISRVISREHATKQYTPVMEVVCCLSFYMDIKYTKMLDVN